MESRPTYSVPERRVSSEGGREGRRSEGRGVEGRKGCWVAVGIDGIAEAAAGGLGGVAAEIDGGGVDEAAGRVDTAAAAEDGRNSEKFVVGDIAEAADSEGMRTVDD